MALAICAACGGAAPVPSGPGLYVSNEMGGDVAVIDLDTRAVKARIPVGKRPRGIRTSPDGTLVYVALSGSPIAGPGVDPKTLPLPERKHDGIGVIDVAQGKLVRTLPSGTDPEQFAVSLDGRRLFIANEDGGTLSVLDVAEGRIVAAIPVGVEPEGVDLSPDGRFVYVTSENDGTVTVVDARSLQAVAAIPVGPRPRSTGFSSDGTRAYVSAENGNLINVIDTASHASIGTIPLSGPEWKPMSVGALARWHDDVRQHRARPDARPHRPGHAEGDSGDRGGGAAVGACGERRREDGIQCQRAVERRVDRGRGGT